ncbi:hypothetical protein [Aquabacterium sp. CECT 9606]|uniref:hypothetical protein n=1 Tax=Aquabacterium sp. CECT 9606 TaxID=2845822 RepID=UPI001E3736B2|nr:hypothetical protein [Aquabacterium sp. CECT 9606]CAH0347919.1 hypothetical protein AQB9606_00138 [Aquabacterium sp. CECT 9606]
MIARVYTKTQPIPFNTKSLSDDAEPEQRAAVPLSTVSWARPALGTHKITTTVRRTALSSGHAAEPAARATTCHSTAGHSAPAPTARRTTQLSAKYLGGGNLSVRSSVTGRHYRFEGHGATLAIDSRDQLMLGRIPELLIA